MGDQSRRHFDVETKSAATAQDLEPFQLGDLIEANYQGRGKWYPAKFTGESDKPGFYSVIYDDSPSEKIRTKKEHVRRPPTQAVSSSSDPLGSESDGSYSWG